MLRYSIVFFLALTCMAGDFGVIPKAVSPSEFTEGLGEKVDKVTGATEDNVATLDADGNLTDSDVTKTSVTNAIALAASAIQDVSDKADKDGTNLDAGFADNAGLVEADSGTATNLTVNTYLNLGTTARFVVLTNGVALQVKSGTNWVTQTEWTED